MPAKQTQDSREEVRDDRGNLTGYRSLFDNIGLELVQTTEVHRTLENDHTVTEVELPGVMDLYLVVNGGRVRLDQFKAPVVLEAIEAANAAQSNSTASATS